METKNQLLVNVAFLIVIIFGFIGFNSFYILEEGKQSILMQFGRPVGNPKVKAGVYLKIPFIQNVRFFEKRILTWDGDPNQIPTKDKKYIYVDTTARWRIIESRNFIETVQNFQRAILRLNDIIDAITRDTISKHNLVEVVRNSNSIVEGVKRMQAAQDHSIAQDLIEDFEIVGEIKEIEIGREKLSEIIANLADKEMRHYGIEILDVQLRRISYEKSVESKVYDRMISERQRIAEKIRSFGKGEKAKIQGRLNRDLKKIQSNAYREAQEIKGVGEAKANRIYAKAFSEDPKFYEFIRSLEFYKKSLKKNSELYISPNSKLFKYFEQL